jgi:hypothetical protein
MHIGDWKWNSEPSLKYVGFHVACAAFAIVAYRQTDLSTWTLERHIGHLVEVTSNKYRAVEVASNGDTDTSEEHYAELMEQMRSWGARRLFWSRASYGTAIFSVVVALLRRDKLSIASLTLCWIMANKSLELMCMRF